MKPTPSTTSVGAGRLVDPRSPDQRERAICAAVSERITDGDVDEALAAIRRGMQAKTTIRAPKKPGTPTKNDYMIVDDVPAQLAAARLLLAYKFGNPSSLVEMKLTQESGRGRGALITREEMLAQLRTSGTDLNGIVGAWLGAARKVSEEGPLPVDLQETVKAVEKLAVVDV